MKAYLNLFKLRVLTNLQYRADVLAGLSTQFFFGFVYIMVYLAFYNSNGTVKTPMECSELVTYVWLMQAFYAIIYPNDNSSDLLKMIRNGNLSYELVRPQNLYVKEFFKIMANKFTQAFLRCGPIIIIAFLLPIKYRLSLPNSLLSLLLSFISLILSGILISAIIVTVPMFTMFTLDDEGLLTLYLVLADVFMGTVIPMPFFPEWLKTVASFLPFRYMADVPFRIYSGNIPVMEALNLVGGAFIWIIITLIIGSIITRAALKKAVIQGG